MYQLGLTGGIGSGKTLVCSVLEKLGVAVYYADTEARKLMSSKPDLARKIMELFGEEAFRGASLNSEYLAKKVFGDPSKLAELNSLVHPVVRQEFSQWANTQKDTPYVVEEAAILFESGASHHMDGTVLVYAPEALRIKRVMERDGVNEENVRRRMMHQMKDDEKKELTDHIIYNDDTEMLLPQIIMLHEKILNSRL